MNIPFVLKFSNEDEKHENDDIFDTFKTNHDLTIKHV